MGFIKQPIIGGHHLLGKNLERIYNIGISNHSGDIYIYMYIYIYTATDRILEMKKGSRAAVSGKGWGPKPRQKISDITDFQKK